MCGGGARLPAVAARAAREGLSGIEFGVNIPGTVGGAVRMNANAYGGELARALEWVEIAERRGRRAPRSPASSGSPTAARTCAPGEIVVRASLLLAPADAEQVKARLGEMRRRRHQAQPQGIKTFGSTFKNPDDPRAEGRSAGLLLAEAGCGGLTIGGARFAPKHANFIENTGSASTADVIAAMAEGRRRVKERFGVELEPEVQTLGDVRFPWRWGRGCARGVEDPWHGALARTAASARGTLAPRPALARSRWPRRACSRWRSLRAGRGLPGARASPAAHRAALRAGRAAAARRRLAVAARLLVRGRRAREA